MVMRAFDLINEKKSTIMVEENIFIWKYFNLTVLIIFKYFLKKYFKNFLIITTTT